jgi:S1-C subfamily serine protease
LVDQIIEFGEVRRGLLGIIGGDVDEGLAEAFNSEVNIGAFVNEVAPDTAAEKAGLKAGDIITKINGNTLTGFNELRAKIASLGAGAEVELTIIRSGDAQKVKVTLDAAGPSQAEAKDIHPALEGAELSNAKDKSGNDAVEVVSVVERSPAASIGLRNGDIIVGVNRKRVNNISELSERIADKKEVIALNVKRGNSNLFIVIR